MTEDIHYLIIPAYGRRWALPTQLVPDLGLLDIDKHVHAWIREHVPRGGVAVDVGAHVGKFTVSLFDHFDHIVAVEPIVANGLILNVNLDQNEIGNVTVVQAAAWKEPGRVHMIVPAHGGETQTASVPYVGQRVNPELVQEIEVECDTVGGFLGTAGVGSEERLAFLKIDVEGRAAGVLEGARSDGSLERFERVMVEVHDLHHQGEAPGVRAIMEGVGFELEAFLPPGVHLGRTYEGQQVWRRPPAGLE